MVVQPGEYDPDEHVATEMCAVAVDVRDEEAAAIRWGYVSGRE